MSPGTGNMVSISFSSLDEAGTEKVVRYRAGAMYFRWSCCNTILKRVL